MNDDYQNVNREYSLNMMDYHRNMNQMINIISNIYSSSRVGGLHNYESPRRMSTSAARNRESLEWELLSYYINQFNNQMRNERTITLTQEQINANTELIHYDLSMNERRCPITHEDFEEGEEICRIISCGHYFKTTAIYRWLQRNTLCPVCRHNLADNNTNTNNNDTHINPHQTNDQSINMPINDTSITNPHFLSNILSNTLPYNDLSFNTVTYTFDIPFNNINP